MSIFRCFLIAGAAIALVGCSQQTGPSVSRRYLIFFQQWSAQLDDSAKSTISAAANLAKNHKAEPITVVGYADPEGSPQANRDISRLRAQIIVDGLVAEGVAPDRIARRAAGSVDFSADSIESRRVEIDVGTP